MHPLCISWVILGKNSNLVILCLSFSIWKTEIHSLKKYVWSAHFMLGTILTARDRAVNKTDKNSYLSEAYTTFTTSKDNFSTSLRGLLWELYQLIHVKHLEQCLPHSEGSWNISRHHHLLHQRIFNFHKKVFLSYIPHSLFPWNPEIMGWN